MKLLLVLNSDDIYNFISFNVNPLGFDLIRYFHILKAMDNIDEIDPRAIIISARDFPRHWKIMLQFVRAQRSKEDCPVIILTGENFSMEERSMASFLGVSGIVTDAMDDPVEMDRLQAILGRFLPVNEKRRSRRIRVEPEYMFGFLFVHPKDGAIVTGVIRDISSGGLSFLPDNPSFMGSIGLNTELKECSLRAGDSILSPMCRLARTGRIVSMEFISLSEEEQAALDSYLAHIPLIMLKKYRITH
jgi:hypothetical protein